MPACSGRKICRRFRLGRYTGNFGSENMPAILSRKKCRQVWAKKKKGEKNANVFRRDKNCQETGNCRRTCRSVKKRSSKNAFAKLCTRSNSARIFFSFFFFSGFFLDIRRKLPALPISSMPEISGKVASLMRNSCSVHSFVSQKEKE